MNKGLNVQIDVLVRACRALQCDMADINGSFAKKRVALIMNRIINNAGWHNVK